MGKEMKASSLDSLKDSYTKFKAMLEQYAVSQKDKINSDPIFRAEFVQMCRSIGVDPLSAQTGAFSDIIKSDAKEFYWGLAIQIQSICLVLKE
jgi:ESCRT-II complex subunit VPS22